MSNQMEYKCPACGGALAFDSASQKLKCPFCDSVYNLDQFEQQQPDPAPVSYTHLINCFKRRRKTMKKLVMIVLSLMLVFAFTACGGGGDSGDKKSEKSDPNVINTGEYTAEYKGYEIVKDSNGDDAIVVTWNFTNNGEESKSFGWAFDYTLFQDGVELGYSTVFVGDSYDTVDENLMKDVKPGSSLEVKSTNKLANLESPVEVEIGDLLSDEKDTLEIDITK